MGNMTVTPLPRIPELPQISSSHTFEPSKPALPRLIKLHQSLGKIGDQASHHFIDRLEHEHHELKIWSQQQLDQLQALANRSLFEQAWSSLDTITNAVVTIFNLVAGAYVLYEGGDALAGGPLIIAGFCNTLQALFNRFGIWDRISETLAEKNQALKDRLKLILPSISFLFSILSHKGYEFLKDHSNINLLNPLGQLKSFLSLATQVGNHYLSLKKGWADANLTQIQGELKFHEQKADLLSRLVEEFIREMKRIKSTLKKPINALMQATTLAAQKV